MIPTPDLATRAPVLTPPRPNLGPLPLDDSAFSGEFRVASVVVVLVVFAAFLTAYLIIRRRRRRRATPSAGTPSTLSPPPDDPRGRLILASKRVRETLEARFGSAWRARTTEEIEASPELAATCHPDDAARLIRLLRAADRAKFDDDHRADTPQRETPDAVAGDWNWLEGALAAAASVPAATPKSRMSGK